MSYPGEPLGDDFPECDMSMCQRRGIAFTMCVDDAPVTWLPEVSEEFAAELTEAERAVIMERTRESDDVVTVVFEERLR